MEQSIHTFFQIGTVQWMSFPKTDVISAIRAIAEDDFFDAIEVTHFEDLQKRRDAIRILEQSHMKIGYGAQPCLLKTGLNPNDINESGRLEAEKLLLDCVEEARTLGASAVAIMAGRWEKENRQQEYLQLLKTTRSVCERAEAYGMNVELEVFDYDVEKCALIGPAPYAAEFAEDVRRTHSNFGLMVDLSHIPTTRETTEYVIDLLKPYITHLHCGNAVMKQGCASYGDRHPRFGFPNGANDTEELTAFFRALKLANLFDAENPMMLSMEVTPQADEEERLVLANTKRVMNRAWALLRE